MLASYRILSFSRQFSGSKYVARSPIKLLKSFENSPNRNNRLCARQCQVRRKLSASLSPRNLSGAMRMMAGRGLRMNVG